jgi:hypothetical protein
MMKRKAKIERRRASGRAAFAREPFEGARSFGISLSRRLCFPSGRAVPSARSSSRALAFARQIADRHAQQSGARTLEFLRSYFGGKYEVIEGHGLADTRIYKKPGGTILESTYKVSLSFRLLLNLTRPAETLNLRFETLNLRFETLNLRLIRKNLTLLQSFTRLMTLASQDASPMNLSSGNTSVVNRTSLMKRWSETRSLLQLLSAHTHAQSTASAAPILLPDATPILLRRSTVFDSTVFDWRDSLARGNSGRASSLPAASVFINRLNAHFGRVTNISAEAERNSLTVLHSMATQASDINIALQGQSLVSAPQREIVSHNFAQTYLQHHFRRGGNLHTALAFAAQSRVSGRVLIRQQNFLRSLSYNSLPPLAQEAAPLAHDFKQTPASLFISETYAMGLTGIPPQPPALNATMSRTLPFRPSLLSLIVQRTLQREILQRRAHLRQGGFANVRNIATRNSLTLMPDAGWPLARFTIARELTLAAVGRSFSWPAVHEKLTREKLARQGLMLESYTLETRTPQKLTVKVRPLSPAAQFVTGGMKKMVIANTRTRLAGPAMISAHTTATINTGAIVNVRLRPAAAAQPRPEPFTLNPGPFTLNVARGAASGGFLEPVPALLFGKVDTLRLTPPVYVYAQPVRSTLEAQRVITQIDHKEVTRIVQREVQSARASDMDVARFSHADYAQIADQVYSTLVRRLIVEKERLGLC